MSGLPKGGMSVALKEIGKFMAKRGMVSRNGKVIRENGMQ